jgi:hypothetical protein
VALGDLWSYSISTGWQYHLDGLMHDSVPTGNSNSTFLSDFTEVILHIKFYVLLLQNIYT